MTRDACIKINAWNPTTEEPGWVAILAEGAYGNDRLQDLSSFIFISLIFGDPSKSSSNSSRSNFIFELKLEVDEELYLGMPLFFSRPEGSWLFLVSGLIHRKVSSKGNPKNDSFPFANFAKTPQVDALPRGKC
jgi:hypothetical protein